jgi:hypothetical protein
MTLPATPVKFAILLPPLRHSKRLYVFGKLEEGTLASFEEGTRARPKMLIALTTTIESHVG